MIVNKQTLKYKKGVVRAEVRLKWKMMLVLKCHKRLSPALSLANKGGFRTQFGLKWQPKRVQDSSLSHGGWR